MQHFRGTATFMEIIHILRNQRHLAGQRLLQTGQGDMGGIRLYIGIMQAGAAGVIKILQ